jgi:subtilisin family serine protease
MQPNFLLVLVLIIVQVVCASECKQRVFVLHLKEDADPDDLAQQHELIYQGHVGNLLHHHQFMQPCHDAERSARSVENQTLVEKLRRHHAVLWIEEQQAKRRYTRDIVDPLYSEQWHIGGMSVDVAWKQGPTGRNVTIAIVDDGLDSEHSDIRPNYSASGSYDFVEGKSTPTPHFLDTHGTSAAGVAAAAADGKTCGVGTAYNAMVSGIRLISAPATDAQEASALTYMPDTNHIYSCSWGPYDDGKRVDGPGYLTMLAIEEAVKTGRNGLGSVYVWAAGNGREHTDSCAYDGYASSRFTISVPAVTIEGTVADYSEACPSNFVAALSSGDNHWITTTGTSGWRSYNPESCRHNFGGTSAAAPAVAGIIALMLESNPLLSWRDVQYILQTTADRIDIDSPSWDLNGAGIWHSDDYGFGLINASAAAETALNWINIKEASEYHSEETYESEIAVNTTLTHIDWVEMQLKDIGSMHKSDLTVTLFSPVGTQSVFASPHADLNPNYIDWIFTSCKYWDEIPSGVWHLDVSDSHAKIEISWSLSIYGT